MFVTRPGTQPRRAALDSPAVIGLTAHCLVVACATSMLGALVLHGVVNAVVVLGS